MLGLPSWRVYRKQREPIQLGGALKRQIHNCWTRILACVYKMLRILTARKQLNALHAADCVRRTQNLKYLSPLFSGDQAFVDASVGPIAVRRQGQRKPGDHDHAR